MFDPPDRISALVSFLKSDDDLRSITKGRIYDEELPDFITGKMPTAAIVVMSAGGGSNIGGPDNDFSDSRVDVRCYAWALESARSLEARTHNLLRHMPTNTQGQVLLHWARRAGGPITNRAQPLVWPTGEVDKTTHWPYVQRAWQVMAADIPVTTR